MGKKTKNIIDRYLSFLEGLAVKLTSIPKYIVTHKLKALTLFIILVNLSVALHLGMRGYCINCEVPTAEEKIKYSENPELLLKLWENPIFIPYEDFYPYFIDTLYAMSFTTVIFLFMLSLSFIIFKLFTFFYKKIIGKLGGQ